MRVKLYHGDAMDLLKSLPDKSVDLVVTDPPYGIAYISNHSKSKEYKQKVHFDNSWDKEFDIKPFFDEMWRVLKDNTHMYIFGRWENYEILTKLKGFKQVLIWDKEFNSMGDLSSWGIGYELIFFFEKGKRAVKIRKPPVLRVNSLSMNFNSSKLYIHPTQKPIDILTPLIEVSSNAGEVVLDPFMGSGSTAIASMRLGRDFIGSELNDVYYSRAKKRIEDYGAILSAWRDVKIEEMV